MVPGTSTGSILATYVATKGAYTSRNILKAPEYQGGVKGKASGVKDYLQVVGGDIVAGTPVILERTERPKWGWGLPLSANRGCECTQRRGIFIFQCYSVLQQYD